MINSFNQSVHQSTFHYLIFHFFNISFISIFHSFQLFNLFFFLGPKTIQRKGINTFLWSHWICVQVKFTCGWTSKINIYTALFKIIWGQAWQRSQSKILLLSRTQSVSSYSHALRPHLTCMYMQWDVPDTVKNLSILNKTHYWNLEEMIRLIGTFSLSLLLDKKLNLFFQSNGLRHWLPWSNFFNSSKLSLLESMSVGWREYI